MLLTFYGRRTQMTKWEHGLFRSYSKNDLKNDKTMICMPYGRSADKEMYGYNKSKLNNIVMANVKG